MSVIAVTGSASGIGAAIRARLARDGQRVIGIDLRDAEVIADLATAAGRAAAIAAVERACGGRLDGLVVCAGVGPHVTDQALIVSLNYFGAQALLDGLRDRAGARRRSRPRWRSRRTRAPCPTPTRRWSLPASPATNRGAPLAAAVAGQPVYGGSKLALTRWVRRHAPRAEWAGAGIRLERRRARPDPDAAAAGRARRCALRPGDPRLSRSHRRVRRARRHRRRRRVPARPRGALLLRQRAVRRRRHRRAAARRPVLSRARRAAQERPLQAGLEGAPWRARAGIGTVGRRTPWRRARIRTIFGARLALRRTTKRVVFAIVLWFTAPLAEVAHVEARRVGSEHRGGVRRGLPACLLQDAARRGAGVLAPGARTAPGTGRSRATTTSSSPRATRCIFSSSLGGTTVRDMPPEHLERSRAIMLNMDPPQHAEVSPPGAARLHAAHDPAARPHIREVATRSSTASRRAASASSSPRSRRCCRCRSSAR